MTAHQVSCRGGMVKVRLEGDRVVLIGQAVTVLRGELIALCRRPDEPLDSSGCFWYPVCGDGWSGEEPMIS